MLEPIGILIVAYVAFCVIAVCAYAIAPYVVAIVFASIGLSAGCVIIAMLVQPFGLIEAG